MNPRAAEPPLTWQRRVTASEARRRGARAAVPRGRYRRSSVRTAPLRAALAGPTKNERDQRAVDFESSRIRQDVGLGPRAPDRCFRRAPVSDATSECPGNCFKCVFKGAIFMYPRCSLQIGPNSWCPD